MINEVEEKKRYQELKEKIHQYDYHYYTLDDPLVSDLEYDRLYRMLQHMEKVYPEWIAPDSPTQRVAGFPLEKFEPLAHLSPMLSLDNVFSREEMISFDEKAKKNLSLQSSLSYIGEPKLDGLSIELIYEGGILTGAATRGDGWTGENVTQNVRTIRSVPLSVKERALQLGISLPSSFRVRGEAIILIPDFIELNREREQKGEPLFANPRNAAAGSLRQLHSTVTAQRKLKAFFYFLSDFAPLHFSTQWEILQWLKQLGFPVHPETALLESIHDAVNYHYKLEGIRSELPFEIDGTVYKLNQISHWEQLGETTRFPRWAIAFKFQALTEETKLLAIEVNVGRTGVLAPSAVLEPVKLGGVTVRHATLHNEDEIKRKDLRVGDTVYIQRAGDVIPHITGVNFSKRKPLSKPFAMPRACPVCNSKVERLQGQAFVKCSNLDCPGRNLESIKYFVSKAGLDIPGLGEKLVEKFFQKGLISNSADIFSLQENDLEQLPGFKEKAITNILSAIEQAKHPPLWRWISALGIEGVGEVTARILAKVFGSWDGLVKASEEDLLKIDQIGPETARNVLMFFNADKSLSLIKKMMDYGLVPEKESLKKRESDLLKLHQKTVVITGTLQHFTREKAAEILQEMGAKVSSAVSSKTSFVLAGENPGSKVAKAREQKIPVFSESDLLAWMEE